jgi:hypothetical protein
MSSEQVPATLKRQVWELAKGTCEYCRSQARFAMQSLSVEHVIPRIQSGPTSLGNLAVACQGCNNHKYSKTHAHDPVTGALVPLFHPRTQVWLDHFAWNDDASLILGLTPVGRATVEALRLNREGLMNLRRILYAAGEHPPPEPGGTK